jgi:hypothetical protein
MKKQRFPKGWNEERVKRLIAELDARTDDEWVAEGEAAAEQRKGQTVITVPDERLPAIRQLLAPHKSA